MSKMKALRPEEMARAKRARPLPLDASWSTGDEDFDARIHASLMQRDELLALAREYRALHIQSLVLGKDCSCTACARADSIIARAKVTP